jgi:peptide deformylase
MTPLPIVTGQDNPVLRRKTTKVQGTSKEIKKLIRDMEDTVLLAKGAGLAAPQVGRTERVCLAMIQKKMRALINPEITWRSSEQDTAEEGCLSLPDVWLFVTRPTAIIVDFTTISGKKSSLKLSGFDARVVQHEVDHLEGILIVDHAGKDRNQGMHEVMNSL